MKKTCSFRQHASLLAAILAVPLTLAALTLTTSKDSHAYDSRIVGGTDISMEQAPGIVALIDKDILAQGGSFSFSQICAGTVIDARWVLTAAHCVAGAWFERPTRPEDVLIMMDSVNLDAPVNAPVNVTEIIIHENYSSPIYGNDIALLRLEVDALIEPVALNTQPVFRNQRVFIAGWGSQIAGGRQAPALQGAYVRATPGETCTTRFPGLEGYPDANNICAGVAQGGIDTCQGDSGGPLYRITGVNLPVTAVAGITSWGFGCAEVGLPGVYTNVAAYTDWIRINSGITTEQAPVVQQSTQAPPKQVTGGVNIIGEGFWNVENTADTSIVYSGLQTFVPLAVGTYNFTNTTTGFSLEDVRIQPDKLRGVILGDTGWWQVQSSSNYRELYQGWPRFVDLAPGNYHVINLWTRYRANFIEIE